MGVPPTFATMMSPNWSTASMRPRVRTPSSFAPRMIRPPGISTFSFWMALLHVDDGEAVGVELVGVEEDADLALARAGQG